MHLSLSGGKKFKLLPPLSFLIILSLFSYSLTPFSIPFFSASQSLLCLIALNFFLCNLVIAVSFSNPTPPPLPILPFVPSPGQVGFLGCPGGNIRWPGTPQQNPGHQGGLLSPYPSLGPLSSTSCFQVQGKVKALRMHSPDFTTRQAVGAVLFPLTRAYSIFSLASSGPHIFISSAQAFTAINNVAKVS